MFQKATYSFTWSAAGAPVVRIELGDDLPAAYTENNLIGIIETIRRKRKAYATRAEYRAALDVFRGALDYLHAKTPVCRCGRPLSQPYARRLGMCVACKLARIRRDNDQVRWTDQEIREKVRGYKDVIEAYKLQERSKA